MPGRFTLPGSLTILGMLSWQSIEEYIKIFHITDIANFLEIEILEEYLNVSF